MAVKQAIDLLERSSASQHSVVSTILSDKVLSALVQSQTVMARACGARTEVSDHSSDDDTLADALARVSSRSVTERSRTVTERSHSVTGSSRSVTVRRLGASNS